MSAPRGRLREEPGAPIPRRGDAEPAEAGALFREHERFLFLLAYRMTGSVADAEDVVQETFARALARPPADTGRPWRPWLARVAANLARDELRRRRRRPYTGPWNPAPIETGAFADLLPLPPAAFEPASTERRYELLESVSLAFLSALEALTPTRRAVLLLQDVLEYSSRETAQALGMTESNARTTLHRARRAMAAYDAARCVPTPERRERTREVLGRFLVHLSQGDVGALEALLAEDAVLRSDGGGEFAAARVPIVGRRRVAALHLKLVRDTLPRVRVCDLNGLPGLVLEYAAAPRSRFARRAVVAADIDPTGRIRAIWTVLASAKLAGVGPA